MSDDPNYSSELERRALDTYLSYVAGDASLDAAVIALRALVDLPPLASAGDEADEADDELDDILNFDLALLPPDHRERHAALLRALEAAYPDTA